MSEPSETPSSSFRVLVPNKVWALTGELDPPSVLNFLEAIHRTPTTASPLLLLDSPGGLAYSALGLYREATALLPSLETRAVGQCASAAVHLLQAGSRRTAYPHAAFFTHALQQGGADLDGATIAKVAEQFARDTAHWVRVLTERTKKKRASFWTSFLKEDRYFPADEALKLGLIDEVL